MAPGIKRDVLQFRRNRTGDFAGKHGFFMEISDHLRDCDNKVKDNKIYKTKA